MQEPQCRRRAVRRPGSYRREEPTATTSNARSRPSLPRRLEPLAACRVELLEPFSEPRHCEVAEVVEQPVDQLVGELTEKCVPAANAPIAEASTFGLTVEQPALPQSADQRQDRRVREFPRASALVHLLERLADSRTLVVPEDAHHLG